MDSYEALIDNPMANSSSGMGDYHNQVASSFSQYSDSGNMNSSYGGLPGLPGSFSGTPGNSSLNLSGYGGSSAQPSRYGNMSASSSSSFSMPYDPPSMQQGSAPLQMAAPPSNPPPPTVSNKTIHSCTYCGLVLSSANALIEHKRIHTGDRPFSCHICDKRFTQKAHLNIHKRTHTGEKPYACHICHKRFAQSSHLSSHKRIHTGEKPFVCGICHIGFTQKQRLDAHIKKHLERGTQDVPVRQSPIRQGPVMGGATQMEQFRQGTPANDDNAFMQMIGHGMPYIKQESGIIGDGAERGAGDSSTMAGTPGPPSAAMRPLGSGGPANNDLRHLDNRGGNENYPKGMESRKRSRDNADDDDGDDEEVERGGNEGENAADPSKSPKISAPSFSSEGMFLHPSGYVAYGGIEDSEESNDHSPGSNTAESSSHQQGNGSSSGGHRRKPSVVRKRYSESPAKENDTVGSASSNSTVSNDFQRFSPLQSTANPVNDNSEGEMDESGTEEFHDTGETLDDKNDPPYHGNVSSKSNVPAMATRQATPSVNQSTVETRSHSRRNINQPVTRPPGELMNGDKISPISQSGGLSYSGHNNSVSNSGLVKVNNRISLVNFTAEELITHLMKRDDIHRCQFCCLIFQDAAMYHIHRNMHDKSDIRRCNMCGKLLQDKYDFTAHFLSMHQS